MCATKHKSGIRGKGEGKEILRLFVISFAGKDQRQKKETQKERKRINPINIFIPRSKD